MLPIRVQLHCIQLSFKNNVDLSITRISNVGALKTLVGELKPIPINAVKKNVAAEQFKADLMADGLLEAQANVFTQVCDFVERQI